MNFKGIYRHGPKVVIASEINLTPVLESPGWMDYGTTPIFTRTLNVAATGQSILTRIAPDTVHVVLKGDGELIRDQQSWFARLPGGAKTRLFISRVDPGSLEAMAATLSDDFDLASPHSRRTCAMASDGHDDFGGAGNGAERFSPMTFPAAQQSLAELAAPGASISLRMARQPSSRCGTEMSGASMA